MRYLDHGNIFLWRSWLNLARHLDHGFDQSSHILVHLVIGAIEVGSGGRADLLRLQLNNEKQLVNSFKNTPMSVQRSQSENDKQETGR